MPYLHGIETVDVTSGGRPVETLRSAVIGVIGTAPDADPVRYPLNEPVLHVGGAEAFGPGGIGEALGTTGTLADGFDAILKQGVGITAAIIRVEAGADEGATMSNIVGASGAMTGVHGFLHAGAHIGVSPRLLLAPGFTSQRPGAAANPVVSEMLGIAARRRAVILADGPNTTMADALAYREDWGSDRVYITDPGVTVFQGGVNVVRPASGFVAGVIARVDKQEGYHVSPSNHEIYGITGTARPVGFYMGDADTEANLLNENRIATIVRDNGWRLWGNETTATDPLNRFLSVRRTHDVVADIIQAAHMWALDRPFSLQLLVDIAETVNGYLRQLRNRQVLLGGKVWIDPGKNTAETWVQGWLTVDYDAEGPAPMQRLTFQFNRNTGYYDELAANAASAIARLSA